MRNKKYISIIIALAIAILISPSCKKESQQSVDLGYNYYPYEIGKYIVYEVDSIVYDDFDNDTDYYQFQLKEIVESIFYDNAGRPTMRLERYVKMYNPSLSYDSIPWTLRDVWAANTTNNTAEKTEENVKYIKLSFPVTQGKIWNGNAYNTLGAQNYTYTDIATPRTVNTLSFDSTLLVTQQNSLNLIEKKYYTEIYAKNIGLVYKESIDIYSGTIVPGVPVTSRIEKGFDFKMKIISYGKE